MLTEVTGKTYKLPRVYRVNMNVSRQSVIEIHHPQARDSRSLSKTDHRHAGDPRPVSKTARDSPPVIQTDHRAEVTDNYRPVDSESVYVDFKSLANRRRSAVQKPPMSCPEYKEREHVAFGEITVSEVAE